MPIVSPQLDDLTYDRVVAELTRRIPVYSPEWTDFNDSDPGYTLIQLFAYLAEMIGYRLNRIPEKNQIELLQLLGIELNPAHAATTRLALCSRTRRRSLPARCWPAHRPKRLPARRLPRFKLPRTSTSSRPSPSSWS